MNISELVGGRPTGNPGQAAQASVVRVVVLRTPITKAESLAVTIPSFTNQLSYEARGWVFKDGGFPIPGDVGVGVLDESGDLFVIGWDGVGSGSQKTAFYDSALGRPDGPNGPVLSGQAEVPSQNATAGAGLTIVDERFTNTAAAGFAAGYVDFDLGVPVRSLGCEFTFETGSTYGGTIALLVWASSVSTAEGIAPDSPCHFYITAEGWGFQYWEDNAVHAITVGQFSERLVCDGETIHRVEIFMFGETAIITLPSGEIAEFSDPHIESLQASFLGYEIITPNSDTDCRPGFITRWGDTVPVAPYDERSRGAHVLRQIASAVQGAEPVVNRPSSVAATITTPTYPSQTGIHSSLIMVVTAPPSGEFEVEVEGYVSQSGDDRLVWAVYGNSLSHFDGMIQTVTERRVQGLQRASFVLSGFAPGEAVQVEWQHTSLSGLSSFVIDTSVYGKFPKMKFTPLQRVVG